MTLNLYKNFITIDENGKITFPSAVVSDLTSGRIPIAGADGLLGDDSDLTFSGDTLTATKIAATTFTGTLSLDSNNNIQWRDAGLYGNSPADGQLDFSSDGDLALQSSGTDRFKLDGTGIGFFNTTPAAQPAHIADATDAASAITQLNAVIAALETLGLVANA